MQLLLPGCAGVSYIYQASMGQLELSNRAQPIDEVLQDQRTPGRTRTLLGRIPDVKAFGEERGLKPTRNYTEFVKLDRRAAVWVVSACEPLRFKAREWSFPIVGSFNYLGWFDIKNAKSHAEELEKAGFDVDVRGARAYSTLGWFRDAVLSTMISDGESALGDLVNVVLHESVHATLYLRNQSFFNESVASFAADKMTPDYLSARLGAGAAELKAYLDSEEHERKRRDEFHRAYQELNALYESSQPDSEKLEAKKRVLAALRDKVGAQREITNATLIQFRTYGSGEAEFETLYRACGKDWRRFWKALDRLKPESFEREQQENLAPVLLPLAREGC